MKNGAELYKRIGKCVWTDDFPSDVPDELCIRAFIEQLEEENK